MSLPEEFRAGRRCSVVRFTDCKLGLDAQPELCDDRDTVTPASKELSNLFKRTSDIRIWNLSRAQGWAQSLLQELHSSKGYPEPARSEGIQNRSQEIHFTAS